MPQRKLVIYLLHLVLLFPMAGATTADEVVFETDFSGGIPLEISGWGNLSGVWGFEGIGHPGNEFSDVFLQNTRSGNPAGAVLLSLSDLPEHTAIDLDFLLAILESWDGGGSVPGAAPDLLNVQVDGDLIFQESFETTDVSPQSYVPPPGVELVHKQQLGNWGHSFPESGYDMGLDPVFDNIAHTSDTLTIFWFASGNGWQGGNDESWAIDNLKVTLRGTAVPEPGSCILCLGGLLGLAFVRRRKVL